MLVSQPTRPMPRITAVTFDLAGTLLSPKPSVGAVYAECASRHGVDVDRAKLDADFPLAFRGAPKQTGAEGFWKEVVRRCFGPALPSSRFDAVFRECWEAFARPEAWRVTPGALPAIAAIRFLGLKVGVLSNADGRMRSVLEGHGLLSHLDGVFLSAETGLTKPDAKAFAHAARQLGGSAASLVHFGDSPSEDGEGARAAGATGVIVGGAHAPDGCLRSEKLADAPYVVRALLTEGRTKGRFSRTVQNLLANLRGLPEDRGRSTDRPLKSIDDAVQDAFRKLRLDKPSPEHAIVAHWHELLPPKLARRAAPLRVLEGGKLVVQCENAVIRSELRFHERAMLAKIRLLPGCQAVRTIGFVSS